MKYLVSDYVTFHMYNVYTCRTIREHRNNWYSFEQVATQKRSYEKYENMKWIDLPKCTYIHIYVRLAQFINI